MDRHTAGEDSSGTSTFNSTPRAKLSLTPAAPSLLTTPSPAIRPFSKKSTAGVQNSKPGPKKILGTASDNFNLDGCSTRDCFMGNFFNDAMLGHARKVAGFIADRSWPDFAFANTGCDPCGDSQG